jgi:tetratricopeptide (TPR) repeat protein
MQHSYRLPEKDQYQLKTQYYDFNQEADKALAVAEMRVDLFPGDIEGRLFLAQLYSLHDRIPETMEQFEAILAINPSQTQYLQQLGALARAEGDFELAADYYQRYADENPDDYRSYTPIASLERLLGNFNEAQRTYERALLLEPNNVSILVNLAGLERHFGNFETGFDGLDAALDRARTRQDSIVAFGALQSAHAYGGRMNEALGYLEARFALSQTVLPPIQILSQQLGILDVYVDAGREDQARAMLAAIEPQLQPPFDNLAALGHLTIALAVDDADAAEAAIPGVQAFIDQLGVQAMQSAVTHTQARILELRDRCEEAIPLFQEELADDPSDISVNTDIGRCQRKAGDLDGAEKSLRTSLVSSPYSPTVHYQMALVFEARGDPVKAVEHLETAMTVWGNADEVFKPAREAREKLAELREKL